MLLCLTVDVDSTQCVRNDTDNPEDLSSKSWQFHTLAECCFENFLFNFQNCMGYSSSNNKDLHPCSPPPQLSGLWYVEPSLGEGHTSCVKECYIGDSCQGRASRGAEFFATFDDCCNTHFLGLDDSPCSGCKENFWDTYFSMSPLPETGYYPVCKSYTCFLYSIRLHSWPC